MTSAGLDIPAPQYQEFVLPQWLAWRREGKACALLTLVRATGGSPRPVGSQMVVCETGESRGYLSGGCIERALVLDALTAIEAGRDHVERYGEGSRFADLRLPCGSGIDIHFDVTRPVAEIARVVSTVQRRQSATLVLAGYEKQYRPALRLVLIGQGPILYFMARGAVPLGMEVIAVSPDDDARHSLSGFDVRPLPDPHSFDISLLDGETALVVLFHDHDYEPELLRAALATPAFYIGALGSRKAQAQRLDRLAEMGLGAEACTRIHGPVGLDIGGLTPPEIALSALAEIIRCYRSRR